MKTALKIFVVLFGIFVAGILSVCAYMLTDDASMEQIAHECTNKHYNAMVSDYTNLSRIVQCTDRRLGK